MGCDIHPIVQYYRGEHWFSLSFNPMHFSRDYRLFTRMAGVRCGHVPKVHGWGDDCPDAVVQPRGWPPERFGLSEMIDDSDMHTPSWLTLDEFKKAAGDDSDADVYATIAAMEEFERRGFKTRLVFAFDN